MSVPLLLSHAFRKGSIDFPVMYEGQPMTIGQTIAVRRGEGSGGGRDGSGEREVEARYV